MQPTTHPTPVFANVMVCPVCGRSFPRFHWGVSGKAGGCGTVKHYGLARYNFTRHLQACRDKHPPEVPDVW
jgi:hypothetical protein